MKMKLLHSFILLLSVSALLLVGCEDTPDLQQVAIVEVTHVTANTAECKVSINLNNSSKITERGITYDSKEWSQQIVVSDANGGDGTFSMTIDGLLPGTVYGIRGFARNSEGVVYSTLCSFKTPLLEGSMTDVEGNVYKTIIIGKQEWMAENLRTTKFNEGTAISKITAAGAWKGANASGAYCLYNNADANKAEYGCLYNWRAVNRRIPANTGEFVLAPEGWRVPSIDDWNTLKSHLILHQYGYNGVQDNVIAKAVASTTLWKESEVVGAIGYEMSSNNIAGFSALPSGYRTNGGAFSALGEKGYFWSSTGVSGTLKDISYFVNLSFDSAEFMMDSKEFEASLGGYSKLGGFSVRCMRDID